MVNKKEYLLKANLRKKVVLPSGFEFEIKKLTGHDFLREGNIPIQSSNDIISDSREKKDIIWNKFNDEQKSRQIEINDKMMVSAVVSPKLYLKSDESDNLSITDLSDEDYFFLLKEIGEFSASRGQDLKPFRQEQNAVNDGHTGAEI